MSEVINEAIIKVTMDASGVEQGTAKIEQAAAKTGRTLDSLGSTPGLKNVGEGANAAAGQVDRATKNMAEAIQRATAAMNAGAKGSAAYYSALANSRGLNTEALKPYIAQLDAVTKKTALAAEAQRQLEAGNRFLDGLRAQAEGIGKTASQLAALRAEELGVVDAARPLIEQLQAAETAAGDAGGSISGFASALSAVAFGAGIAAISQLSDEYSKYLAQLKLATFGQTEFANAQATVRRIATTSQSDLSATASLYASITKSTRELGIAQIQVATITESISLALKVSGASSAEASSAILQLSQAFASGALRGDEFNSVNEAAPRLMQALADGIGVPVGALRKMAEEGQLTTAVLADALPRALGTLRNEARSVETIGGAVTVLKNNVLELVGATSQSSGVVAVLSGGIKLLADNLVLAGGAMATVVAARLGVALDTAAKRALETVAANRALAAANLATAQSNVAVTAAASATAAARVNELRAAVAATEGNVALAIATNGLIPAQTRAAAAASAHAAGLTAQAAAARAASVAGGLARGALAALGGPVGAVVTLLGLGATAWAVWGDSAKDAEEEAAGTLKASTEEILQGLEKQIEKLRERNRLAAMGFKPAEVQSPGGERLAEIVGQLDRAGRGVGEYASLNLEARAEILKVLGKEYGDLTTKIEEFNRESAADTANRNTKSAGEWMAKYATNAEKMRAEVDKARKDLGAAFTPELEARIRKQFEERNAGATKEANAYRSLADAINERAGAAAREAAGLGAITESQKLQARLDAEVLSGTVKLSQAQKEKLKARIDEIAVSEKVIESQKLAKAGAEAWAKFEKERANAATRSIAEAVREAEKNEELASTFGLARSEIEQLELARLEEQLAQRSSLGLTLDEIETLEKLIDAKKRSSAALVTIESKDLAKKASEQAAAEWKRAADSIEQSLTDALLRGFESGKSFGKNLIDTLKNMFSTLVLRPVVSAVVSPVAGALTGALGLAGTAQAATEGGSALGNASGVLGGIGALSGPFGAGLSSGLSAWAAEGSVMGLLNSGALFGGGIASGLGAIAGALGPIALGIGAAVAIWKKMDTSGTYHTGGAASASADGVSTIRAESLKFEATRTNAQSEQFVSQLASGVVSILDSTALAFGKTTGYTAATAFADDTSKDGAWGALVISKMGEKLIDWQDTRTSKWAPKEFADGEAGQKQYLEALSKSVRTALDGIGLPTWAQSMLDSLGKGASIEEMAKSVESINATQAALKVMGDQLIGFSSLSDSAVSALMKAAGGIQSLATGASAYYDNFYSETEKNATVQKQVAEALKAVNRAVPATREEFRKLVEDQLALGEAGAPAAAVLFKIAGAFAQLHPLVEAVTAAVEDQAEVAQQAAKDLAAGLMGGVDSAFSALQRVVNREKSLLQDRITKEQELITKHQALSSSLRGAIDSMGNPAEGLETRQSAQAQIQAALAIAKAGGVLPSADSLKSALSVLSKDSAGMFASQQDYLRDFYLTRNSLEDLADVTDDTLSIEERSLKNLESQLTALDKIVENGQAQLDKLNGLDVSQLSLADAIKAFMGSVGAVKANPVASGASNLTDLYQEIFERAPDAGGLAYWQDRLAGGISFDAIRKTFLESAESKKLRGFAIGTNFVPTDMPALIHQGERIIPAADNRELMRRLSNPEQSNAVLAAAVERLTREVEGLRSEARATATHTEKSARLLGRVVSEDVINVRMEAE